MEVSQQDNGETEDHFVQPYAQGKGVRIGRARVGKGIFASRPLPVNAVIGEITGEKTDDPDYGSEYSFDIGDGYQLEPSPPFRFVNHSCEPNCEFDWDDDPEVADLPHCRRVYMIALRDIEEGEELTIDYNWTPVDAIVCRCGAPTCRGLIVDESFLTDDPTENTMSA